MAGLAVPPDRQRACRDRRRASASLVIDVVVFLLLFGLVVVLVFDAIGIIEARVRRKLVAIYWGWKREGVSGVQALALGLEL